MQIFLKNKRFLSPDKQTYVFFGRFFTHTKWIMPNVKKQYWNIDIVKSFVF